MPRSTIDIAPKHLALVRSILRRDVPHLHAYAFGSRVTGAAKKFSDLDIALVDPTGKVVAQEILWKLRDEFSESDLPIFVDLVNYSTTDAQFQQLISEKWIQIFPSAQERCDLFPVGTVDAS